MKAEEGRAYWVKGDTAGSSELFGTLPLDYRALEERLVWIMIIGKTMCIISIWKMAALKLFTMREQQRNCPFVKEYPVTIVNGKL